VNEKALKMAGTCLSNEVFQSFLALAGNNVSPAFNAEMVKLVEEKAVPLGEPGFDTEIA